MQPDKIIRVNVRGVVNLRLEDLNPFQEDIKILTDERYKAFKEEILEDGFSFSPHVFQDGGGKWWILDGHQRRSTLERMKAEGYEIPVLPCMEVEAESLEHARRLVLAGTSEYGTFQVKNLVSFTQKTGLTGEQAAARFSIQSVDFKKLISVGAHTRTPAPPADVPLAPKTKPGQVYILGRHLLMCGDATQGADFQKLMGKELADICFTSPPYNAATEITKKNREGKINGGALYTENADDLPSIEYVRFMRSSLNIAINRTARWVFWNVNYNGNCRSEFLQHLQYERLEETICWHKRQAVALKFGLTRRWEPIFVFRCEDAPPHLYAGGKESNVWEIVSEGGEREDHRASFPVLLPQKALELVPTAETILDPFGGTGSTLIAAELLNKKCFMMEISAGYCDAIISRWEKTTGLKATLRV